jgi:hypothetical protein
MAQDTNADPLARDREDQERQGYHELLRRMAEPLSRIRNCKPILCVLTIGMPIAAIVSRCYCDDCIGRHTRIAENSATNEELDSTAESIRRDKWHRLMLHLFSLWYMFGGVGMRYHVTRLLQFWSAVNPGGEEGVAARLRG